MSDHADVIREALAFASRMLTSDKGTFDTAHAALDALVARCEDQEQAAISAENGRKAAEAERDSWRTLAEGWKLTDDVRKSSDQRRTDRSHSTE